VTLLINILILLAGFIGMEGMAWFSHKYIMHGFMWRWHKSHHEPRHGRFEKNDLFGIVFAIISIILIASGSLSDFDWKFYLGLGIMFYGFAYFLVHDIFVHQRLPWLKKTKSPYFQAMRFAHKIHHKVHTREGAEAFGFLFVSRKYLSKYRQRK
jgi:beta-carotene 3-hydroxylase